MPLAAAAGCRALLAGVLVLASLALAAPRAGADADPASDALLVQPVFFPYQPVVSANATNALNKVVNEAAAAHFPIKVALIATQNDMGGLPNLFAQPQRYADFLDREISFNSPVPLLVVMPQGFGTAAVGKQGELNPLLPVDPNPGSDGLALAAIKAIEKLAADAGHPLAPVTFKASAGKSGGGTSPAIFAAPVALVLIAAAGLALIRRHQPDEEEEPLDV